MFLNKYLRITTQSICLWHNQVKSITTKDDKQYSDKNLRQIYYNLNMELLSTKQHCCEWLVKNCNNSW